jgi:regulator of protease activity HflC (stomatin/prohibitin superfamily)
MGPEVVVLIIVAVFILLVIGRTVRIVPQARAGIVERFGRYNKTLLPGLNVVVPFVDRLRPLIDLREQVVSFPSQPVITEDNLVVGIDTVFEAIHQGRPDAELLAYQYLQILPQIARGDANKLWIVPSEMGKALEALGGLFGNTSAGERPANPVPPVRLPPAAGPTAESGDLARE